MSPSKIKIQFTDLAVQQKRIRPAVDRRIASVLSHGRYIMGPEVAELEKKMADYLGVGHAVTCSSGTDALLMALMALGIGPGHAVFTTPFSFVATAEVIAFLGAVPIFVDVDPGTFNMDPKCFERAVTSLVRGGSYPLPKTGGQTLVPGCVIPVDLFGLPADYERINQIAKAHDIKVLSDAAQSFGATLNHKKACTWAHLAATSFFPSKPLGCYGDGGAVFTNDDGLAEQLRSIRVHGKGSDKYDNVRIGLNGRMDTIQAAVLLEKLAVFDEEIVLRQQVAENYRAKLSQAFSLQETREACASVWAQFSLVSDERQTMLDILKDKGIPTAVYYPRPLHCQRVFSYLGYGPEDFPVSLDLSQRIFSLPMHPYLRSTDVDYICEVLLNN